MIKVPLFSHTARILRVMQKDRGVTCMHVGKANSACTTRAFQFVLVAIEGLSGGEITW